MTVKIQPGEHVPPVWRQPEVEPPPRPAPKITRVADLVAHLLTLPQDYPVLAYDAGEDYSSLGLGGVRVYGDGEEQWWDNAMNRRDDGHVTIIGGYEP